MQPQPALSRDALQGQIAPLVTLPDNPLDGIAGWQVDWDDDGAPDVLAQVTYGYRGGNAVFHKWYIFALRGDAITPVTELKMPGDITALYDLPGLVAVQVRAYGDGDPRCCPSLVLNHWIAKP